MLFADRWSSGLSVDYSLIGDVSRISEAIPAARQSYSVSRRFQRIVELLKTPGYGYFRIQRAGQRTGCRKVNPDSPTPRLECHPLTGSPALSGTCLAIAIDMPSCIALAGLIAYLVKEVILSGLTRCSQPIAATVSPPWNSPQEIEVVWHDTPSST